MHENAMSRSCQHIEKNAVFKNDDSFLDIDFSRRKIADGRI